MGIKPHSFLLTIVNILTYNRIQTKIRGCSHLTKKECIYMLQFIGLIMGISLVFGVILFLLAKKTDNGHSGSSLLDNGVKKETVLGSSNHVQNQSNQKFVDNSAPIDEDYTTTLQGNVVQDPTKLPLTPSEYQRMISNATPFERARIEQEMLYNPLHPGNLSHKMPIHYDEAIREDDDHEQELYAYQEQQRMMEEQRLFEEQQMEEMRAFQEQQEQQQYDEQEFWNQQNQYQDDQNQY